MQFSLKTLSLGLLLLSSACWGLESDRQQPIHIQADRITVHEKGGVSYYEGNVQFTQGSLQIHGDEIIVHLQEDVLQKIIVTGTPATLQQQPESDQELVHSRASRMEYDAMQQIVTLVVESVWMWLKHLLNAAVEKWGCVIVMGTIPNFVLALMWLHQRFIILQPLEFFIQ